MLMPFSCAVWRLSAGLEWITANAKGPSVVTLSLGVAAGTWSRAMEAAVRSTINDHGISLIIAAGNSAEDSCGISPGNVPEAITVAASNLPNKFSTTRQGEVQPAYTPSASTCSRWETIAIPVCTQPIFASWACQ
jgi:hypothetical protein